MFENGRLLVFARTPEMGKVKTRLQPELGEQGCYQLHERLVSLAIETAVESKIAPVEVWHTGNPEKAFWQEKAREHSFVLREQQGSDLGLSLIHI